jgi:hypothetical protein
MRVWDYDLPKNWQPKTQQEWEWFLVRKINYDDFKGLQTETIRKYFPKIKSRLDPGKRAMFEDYLQYEISK